jgi:hypothetical protein
MLPDLFLEKGAAEDPLFLTEGHVIYFLTGSGLTARDRLEEGSDCVPDPIPGAFSATQKMAFMHCQLLHFLKGIQAKILFHVLMIF